MEFVRALGTIVALTALEIIVSPPSSRTIIAAIAIDCETTIASGRPFN